LEGKRCPSIAKEMRIAWYDVNAKMLCLVAFNESKKPRKRD